MALNLDQYKAKLRKRNTSQLNGKEGELENTAEGDCEREP